MHLLKQGSKAVGLGRKRKRHEVFDAGAPANNEMFEENKGPEPGDGNDGQFQDVTHTLKKSKRNRGQNNQE